jgi:hypothetical protein
MGFNLLDCVQGYTDYDQEGCSSKIEGDIKFSIEDGGQDADGRDINRSSKSDPSEHFINILSRLLPRTDARDITAKFFHVIGHIIWVKGDRRVKIAKEDDKSHIEKIIEECPRA